jgi:putative ABC transport system permease protein
VKNYKKLIPIYLKQQYKRTISVAAAIIMATALIIAMVVLGRSHNINALAAAEFNYGKEHALFANMNYHEVLKLKSENSVTHVGVREYLGYGKLKNGKEIVLEGYDKKSIEMGAYTIYKGRFPVKKNEIAIEKWMLDNLKLKRKCGQILDFDIQTGYQDKNYETQKYQTKAKFKLVGILNDNYQSKKNNSGSAMAVYGAAKKLLPKDFMRYASYFCINSHSDMVDKINRIKDNFHDEQILSFPNTGLITELELLEPGEDSSAWDESPKTFFMQNIPIILAILMIIYNIFNISIMSRMSQLGIMRSIGAKPGQIRLLVFGEALYISLISIPLGILAGLGSAKLCILLGTSSMGKAAAVATGLYIPVKNCLLGVLLVIAAVVLAVVIPAYRAGKVPPMVAVNGKTGYIKTGENKTGFMYRFLMKRFSISFNIAIQNIWRNRKRALITVLCMSICGVIYIGERNEQYTYNVIDRHVKKASEHDLPFLSYHDQYEMSSYLYDTPIIKNGYTESDYKSILNTKGVADTEAVRSEWTARFIAGRGHIAPDYIKTIKKEHLPKSDQALFTDSVRTAVTGLDDRDLKLCSRFLDGGKVNIEAMKKQPIVLIKNKLVFYEGDNVKKVRITTYKLGDTIKMRLPYILNGRTIEKTYECKVGGILSDKGDILLGGPGLMPHVVLSTDMLKKLTNSSLYQSIYVKIKKGLKPQDIKRIGIKFKGIAYKISGGNFKDKTKEDAQSKSMTNQQKIIEAAILLSLIIIAIVNIFNTASTNLFMRMREFGLMKIVGITMRQLSNVVLIEMVLYALVSTTIAFIGGYVKGYIAVGNINYMVSWRGLIIVFCSYMVFSLLAAVMPLRRIIKSSAVESIRMVE